MTVHSSGVNMLTVELTTECGHCEWAGTTLLDIDRDLATAIWTCPDCHTPSDLWVD